jgi:hypothetical protein
MAEKNKGLGDVVENIAKHTGIKKAVDWFADKTGLDCGCDRRKETLNNLFPFKRPECMNEHEYGLWTEYRQRKGKVINTADQQMIAVIHARLFNHSKYLPCSCDPKAWQDLVNDIDQIYMTYEAGSTAS